MKSKSQFKTLAPVDNASLISRLTYGYTLPTIYNIIKHGHFQTDHQFKCPKADEAEALSASLSKNWNEQLNKKNPNFATAFYRSCAGSHMLIPLSLFIFEECFLRIIQALMLGQMLKHLSTVSPSSALETDPQLSSSAYKWACLNGLGLILTTFFLLTMHNLTLFHDMRLGMRAKVAASSLLYQKLLKLSQSSMASTSSAQLINFLSTDLGRLDDFCCIAPHLVIAPLQTIAILTTLWSYLGTAATLVGFSLLLALIPLQSFTGKLSGQFRAKTATQTDTRLKLTTEIIASMRSVKAFNWEGPLGKRIFDARSNEIKALSNGTFLKAINISIFFTAYRVVCFACLVVYVLHGEKSTLLTPEVIFVSLALLNRLRLTTTNCLPSAIAMTAELLVTCRRIQAFLLLDEVEKEKATENQLAQSEKFKVKAEHVTAKWSQTKSTVLNNVSFSLKRGELLAVIGPVGSGKSSLLFGLLGELLLISGSLKMAKNTLSYASQEAFIVFDSVRNNILFGETYQAERYQTVIMACALQRDIEELPEGDQTMVGIGENQSSKGTVVQLSGGQRARVALARAVYRQADVYLLDDSLSAVDAPVAQHIFQKCILELLNGKTTILVTHQLQFLEQTNKILFLDDKNPDIPAFVGSYNELQRSGKLKDVLQTIGKNSNNKTEKETSSSEQLFKKENKLTDNLKKVSSEDLTTQTPPQQISKLSIYLKYFKASGGFGPLALIQIFLIFISQITFHSLDLFLASWTRKNSVDNSENYSHKTDILLYTVLIVVLFTTTFLRSITFYRLCMKASVRLHEAVFRRLLGATMTFFDAHSQGEVLNVLGKDLATVDEQLQVTLYEINLTLGQIIGFITVAGIVRWQLLLAASILLLTVFCFAWAYLQAIREIKRVEALKRSPIYSHLSTTLNGLTSIRAFRKENRWSEQFTSYLNDHSALWFFYLASSRAMALFVDWAVILYVVAITTTVMTSEVITGSEAGLAITSGLTLTGMIQWLIKNFADLEGQMNSVERVVAYQVLEQEQEKSSIQKIVLEKEWPSEGSIKVENLKLFYNNNPVLRNINFSIYGGEKVGIVGRTSAGKSSLVGALLQLYTPEKGSVISIDGVDTTKIDLNLLRKSISIIDQRPVLFSGSVRFNLDPFGVHSEDRIWAALKSVELAKKIQSFNFKEKLDQEVSLTFFSAGELQLLQLARAILEQNKILLLDEATSNVDMQTDALVQKTIRKHFFNCTVLTVAHRLSTIIDCDRVMVLEAGQIVEFDAPSTLLKRGGLFAKMCQKTGENMYEHLRKQAEI